jgi:hypothetical protein
MRLSLTLIASFCFFFKSFASGSPVEGYVWFNNQAGPNDCNPDDAALVDIAVDDALELVGVTTAHTWVIQSQSYGSDRSLRGGGRELCSDWCINRCNNVPYLCYGICEGCRRKLNEIDDNDTENNDSENSVDSVDSIDDSEDTEDTIDDSEPWKSICETAVRGQALNGDISATCRPVLAFAKCQMHIL